MAGSLHALLVSLFLYCFNRDECDLQVKEGATKVSTTQQQRQKRSLLTGRSADPDVQDYPLRLLLGPVILKGSKPHHNDRTPSSSKENNERQMSKFWYAGLDGIWSTQDGGCKGNRKPGSVAGVDMLLGYPRFIFTVNGLFHF